MGYDLVCSLTLNRFAQVLASALLLNDQLVNFSGGYVVVPMQGNIQKPFIVSQIQIHLGAIVQNVNLACEKNYNN